MRTWGDIRRWLTPDETCRRLRRKIRHLQGKLRATEKEAQRWQAATMEHETKAELLATQSAAAEEKAKEMISGLRFEIEALQSALTLKVVEAKTLTWMVKEFQAHKEHDAAIKLIDLEMVKQRVQQGRNQMEG